MKQGVGIAEVESHTQSFAERQDAGDALLAPMVPGWRRGAGRFAANRLALVGLVVVVILLLAGIFAPLITPASYDAQSLCYQYLCLPIRRPLVRRGRVGPGFLQPQRLCHPHLPFIGFGAAIISALIGIPLGAVSGFYGGMTDWSISRVLEVFQIIPPLTYRYPAFYAYRGWRH